MTSSINLFHRARRKLLITGLPPQVVISRASAAFDLSIWRETRPIGAELASQAEGHDAVIVMPGDKLDAATIASLPQCVQVLGTYSVGYDHIDLSAATARRLPVFNTPDVLTESVADLALFLILAAARNTTAAERTLRERRWGAWAPTAMLGRSLQGLRLGIFGMGRIGQAVAVRAQAFGMHLHYHNRSRLPVDRELGGVFHDSLKGMLSESDVLCICAPSTPELRDSINVPQLACLPHGAMVVNVARGDLVNEPALFAAVSEGRVSGIGFDVYRNEPHLDERWLGLPNATLLPHIGSATQEVRTAMGMLALHGVESHFNGEPAANLLNPAVYG